MSYSYTYQNSWGAPPFKSVGKPPVKGGRWKIRRGRGLKNPWRAWSVGKSSSFSRSFKTQQEAIDHATLVAGMFANPTPANVRTTIEKTMPWITPMAVAARVVRYAKYPKYEDPTG